MSADRFDRILWVALAGLLAALVATAANSYPDGDGTVKRPDRNLERQLAERARTSYFVELYAPVNREIEAGRLSRALLALESVERGTPADAYGMVLKGVVLARMDAIDSAVENLARGIRLNGDYIERHGALSQRALIEALVEEQLPRYAERVAADPADEIAATTKRRLHYLQSRLAGGCE